MEDVGADLAAPFDLLHLALDVGHLLLALALAQLQQLGFEHADTVLAVVHLVAAGLGGDDDARRVVRHAHGGGGLVDVLSARARGVVHVRAHVLHVDLDLVVVVLDDRGDVQRGEARLPARVRVKRADAHQAVYALLAAQEAVGVLTGDFHGDGLEARLVAVQQVDDLHVKAVALAVALIHAAEHLCPILRLGAARAGMQGDISVVAVVVAAQQRLQAQLRQVLRQLLDLLASLGHEIGVSHLLGQLHRRLHVVRTRDELAVMLQLVLDDAHLLGDLRGALQIIPEIRFVHGLVQLHLLLPEALDVQRAAHLGDARSDLPQLLAICIQFDHAIHFLYSIHV